MIIRDFTPDQIVQAILRAAAGRGPLRCVSDHRRLQGGDVWFAIPGQRHDPRQYLGQVAHSGLGGVIAEAAAWTPDMDAAALQIDAPVYLLAGLAARAGEIAADLVAADTPMPRLVAVTGTNGKTSVTRWVAQSLTYLDERCAVLGTLGAGFVDNVQEYSGLTTPDAVSLQNAVATMARNGARTVALEASSIGLDQGRLAGCRFHVAAYTNLSRDHLDYHGTMEAYERAKQKLFCWPDLHHAVINLDDPAAARFCAVASASGVKVIGVTAAAADADRVRAAGSHVSRLIRVNGVYQTSGTAIELECGGVKATADVPVVGHFNLENLAVVAGVLLACGYDIASIADALTSVTPPPGRMQMINRDGHPLVVVDYAHTPDALEKVLLALRPVAQARGGALNCLFGCGGDRDPGKRPLMGAVAQRLADRVVVTSDNPRHEDPQAIIDSIVSGMVVSPALTQQLSREQAIAQIVTQSQESDVVLLAGKGHEVGQTIGDEVLPFSDAEQAELALNAWAVMGRGA